MNEHLSPDVPSTNLALAAAIRMAHLPRRVPTERDRPAPAFVRQQVIAGQMAIDELLDDQVEWRRAGAPINALGADRGSA
jgi:hypothetical protein